MKRTCFSIIVICSLWNQNSHSMTHLDIHPLSAQLNAYRQYGVLLPQIGLSQGTFNCGNLDKVLKSITECKWGSYCPWLAPAFSAMGHTITKLCGDADITQGLLEHSSCQPVSGTQLNSCATKMTSSVSTVPKSRRKRSHYVESVCKIMNEYNLCLRNATSSNCEASRNEGEEIHPLMQLWQNSTSDFQKTHCPSLYNMTHATPPPSTTKRPLKVESESESEEESDQESTSKEEESNENTDEDSEY